jgi:hypothetical protein
VGAILMVAEGESPHPGHTYGRGIGLEDVTENLLANLIPAIDF